MPHGVGVDGAPGARSVGRHGAFPIQWFRREVGVRTNVCVLIRRHLQVEALRRRVSELEARNSSSGETMALEKRCSTLVKERKAVQTIMEEKIRVLLQVLGWRRRPRTPLMCGACGCPCVSLTDPVVRSSLPPRHLGTW